MHAEELRSKFVAPEGKMPLEIWDLGSRHTVDFGRLAEIFKLSLKNRVSLIIFSLTSRLLNLLLRRVLILLSMSGPHRLIAPRHLKTSSFVLS